MAKSKKDLPDCEDLLCELAFRCPELGPAISRVSVAWDESVMLNGQASACVNGAGRILIHPDLADVAVQVLAHEIMHLVGEHFIDMPAPQWDPLLANIAGDIWLNGILQDLMPAVQWPPNWLYPGINGTTRDMTARQVYAELMTHARPSRIALGAGCAVQGSGSGSSANADPGASQGPPGGSGQPGQDPQSGPGGIDAATAAGIMAGIGSVVPRALDAVTPPPPVCTIADVLREAGRAAAGNAHPRATFARLGRRSTPMVPRRGRVKRGPQLIVIVDISGSMFHHLETVRRECTGLAHRARVHLILHDTEVHFSGRVGRDKIAGKIQPAGGTDFRAAYDEAGRVAAQMGQQCAIVHFTDGEVGEWPAPPAPVPSYVGLTTDDREPYRSAPSPWRSRRVRRSAGR